MLWANVIKQVINENDLSFHLYHAYISYVSNWPNVYHDSSHYFILKISITLPGFDMIWANMWRKMPWNVFVYISCHANAWVHLYSIFNVNSYLFVQICTKGYADTSNYSKLICKIHFPAKISSVTLVFVYWFMAWFAFEGSEFSKSSRDLQ